MRCYAYTTGIGHAGEVAISMCVPTIIYHHRADARLPPLFPSPHVRSPPLAHHNNVDYKGQAGGGG